MNRDMPDLPAMPLEMAKAQEEARAAGKTTRTYVSIRWILVDAAGPLLYQTERTEFICRSDGPVR